MTIEPLERFVREDRLFATDDLISLRDVIDRRIAIHWDEAVAVVEECCEVAIAGSGDSAPVPDVEDVAIGSNGRVTLVRARGDKSPTAAGRMLHTLLSISDVPMALRLFVAQSTAQGTHGSLREFARALAYFGKPARQQMIQDVYRRCTQAGPGIVAAPTPPSLPKRDSKPAKVDRQPGTKRRSTGTWLLAVAAVGIAGSGAWLWSRGASAPDAPAGASRVLSDAAVLLSDLGQQVRDAINPPPPASTTAASSSDAGRRARVRRRPASSLASGLAVEPAPLENRQASLGHSARAWQLAAAVPNAVAFQPEDVYQRPESEPDVARVYSSANRDVEPPVLMSPRLTPSISRPVPSAETVNRMVVVVSPEGTVERVQLVEGPARMVDMMLLSGAKTWRFAPALKDGEPVRYRTVISWTAVP